MVQSIESRFETFSSNWLERCREYKTIAISEDLAAHIQKDLETDLYLFKIQAGITGEETGDLEKDIKQLQRYLSIALAKGRANHARETSRKRRFSRVPLREIIADHISSRRQAEGPREERR
ncbi:hypothetical protein E2N92_11460 [Methanofollis formosanus]|uniref:Uncharacterized protein n=1 Tax=Methanofollis formosanus TaxID=299308 RepID=A0A8G1EHA2_9EURY|nr:hypothetical protein [Methanofollis formosanus]QYZ79996.1 hypothetical protein E2N92_11460 [Methanofollis formosanus]